MARDPIVMIADDLTGALDSAAPFRTAGLAVGVALTGEATGALLGGAHDVLVVNTDSRELPAAEARLRLEAVCARLSHLRPRLWIKKIDSRLKGPIGAEIDVLRARLGLRRAMLCPAVPDQGRFVREGRVVGTGIDAPLALADCLGDAPGVDLIDGEDAEDMRRIARMLLDAAEAPLAVGARGLAQGLATEIARERGGCGPGAATLARPLLLVIGSRDPITTAQVDALLDSGLAVDCPAPGGALDDGLPDAPVLLVRAIDDGVSHAPALLAERLAREVAGLIADRRPATLFLAGGDTAQAVLKVLGAELLEIEGEALPGVPVCRIPGSAMRVVTKSGGFGGIGALVDIAAAAAPRAHAVGTLHLGVSA